MGTCMCRSDGPLAGGSYSQIAQFAILSSGFWALFRPTSISPSMMTFILLVHSLAPPSPPPPPRIEYFTVEI